MPRTIRLTNLLAALTCLASGLAVLASTAFDPAYRTHYRDAAWFVLLYVVFYGAVVWAFASRTRDRQARVFGVVKTLGAYLFLATFPFVGQTWMVWTPGRYVYQLFDWGPEARIVTMAYVFLGRGAWNTVNAFVLMRELWMPLRVSRPFLGRLVTAVPAALLVAFVWAFLALARMNAQQFSVEAHDVAQAVLDGIGCDDLHAKAGTSTSDVRQRGERRYEVTVDWNCADVRVLVRAEDGRLGTARAARPECCPGESPSGADR